MRKTKYTFLFLIIFIILQFTFVNISLATDEESLKLYTPSCILIETSTGKILYEKNANEVRYPASTTKIMTAILTLEKCKLTDTATVSHNAVFSIPLGYTHANLREGEKLTIEQLLNALLIPSANDAAVVLAEHISGSTEEFANLMNEKAKELGCQNTHFVNPNGIHNKEHVTTAYDLSLMAKYAMKNSTFREIVKKTSYTLPATNKYSKANRTFTNTNELLRKNHSDGSRSYYYADAIGIKTGYTDEAGSCLVAGAKRDNMEVIAVILGDGAKGGLSERCLDATTLFNYAFDNYSIKTVNEKNSVLQEISVYGATKETKDLDVIVKEDINILLKNGDENSLQPNVEINKKLRAPISSGSTVGKITYVVDGNSYSSELIAKNNVEASGFLPILFRVLLIIIVLALIYVLLKSGRDKNDGSKKGKKSKTASKEKSKNKSKASKNNKKSGKKNNKGNYRFTQVQNIK